MKKKSFYINAFTLVKSNECVDLSDIPSSHKRRLSNVDKVALFLFRNLYKQNIDEIVFSSIYGEFERLNSIIEQYSELNEVSPMQFAGSVHNAPVGYFCHINNCNIPYSAIASDNNSISNGLIKAIISENKSILFCYADFMETSKGISCIISDEKLTDESIECVFESVNEINGINEFVEFSRFLKDEIDEFSSGICRIARVK